jgi:NAD(P)-dependent dehydrogenase (short-subunit alcohol dehydrogenase family)
MILPDLKDGVAIVTGASGGIGTAVCNALLDQGTRIFAIDRVFDSAKVNPNYMPLVCDLMKTEEIENVFSIIHPQTDHVDYLVNIAGIDSKYSLEEGSKEQWHQIIDLNLRGYYLIIRNSHGLLIKGQGKSIVNVSSINYRLGIPRRSIYSVSKAGILGLTTGLARELGKDGIRINTISPGWVFTEKQVSEYFTQPEDRAKYLNYLEQKQAINRHISPEDIAQHVLFYLSVASAASTGHNCVVDCGWLLE